MKQPTTNAKFSTLFASLLLLATTTASFNAIGQSYGVAKAPEPPALTANFLDLTEAEMEAEIKKVWGDRGPGSGLVRIPILFSNGAADVSADVVAKLAKLANVLGQSHMAKARLSIEGHANATGSAEVNQRLTDLRANRVMRVLIREYGVAPGRLEARGFGAGEPRQGLDPTHPANRRVEMRVLGERRPAP